MPKLGYVISAHIFYIRFDKPDTVLMKESIL